LAQKLAPKEVAQFLVAGEAFDGGNPSAAVDRKAQAQGIGDLRGCAWPGSGAALNDCDSGAQIAHLAVALRFGLKPADRLSSRIAATGSLSVLVSLASPWVGVLFWQAGQGVGWDLLAVADQTCRPYSSRAVGVSVADSNWSFCAEERGKAEHGFSGRVRASHGGPPSPGVADRGT